MQNKTNLLLTSIISLALLTFSTTKTDNGVVVWEEVGSTGTRIEALCSKDNTLYAATGGNGVFKKNETENDFVPIGLPGIWLDSIHNMNGTLFAGTWDDGIFKTTENDITWTNVGLADEHKIESLCSENGILFAGTPGSGEGKGVFKTANKGDSWIYIGPNNTSILDLASMNGAIYAATAGGYGIFKTTDEGANWINVGLADKFARTLCPVNGVMYTGTYSEGVYKTSNEGVNWTSTTEFTESPIDNLFLMNNMLYALARSDGVFETSDGGNNWVNIGLIEEGAYSLGSLNGELFAGTGDGRVLKKTVVYYPSESWISNNWRVVLSVGATFFGLLGTIYGIRTNYFKKKVLSRLKTTLDNQV